MKKIKFITIQFEILEKLNLTITEYCLIDIINILSKNNRWCWASKETLADIVQKDRSHIFLLLKKLINQGLLEKNKEDSRKIRPTQLWYNEFIIENKNYNKKKKPYYKGMQVVKKDNKLFCIPNGGGTWLEFVGDEVEIEWK